MSDPWSGAASFATPPPAQSGSTPSDPWSGVADVQPAAKLPDMSGVHQTVQKNIVAPQTETGQQRSFGDVLNDTLKMPVTHMLGGQADKNDVSPAMRGHLMDAYSDGTAHDFGDFMQTALPYASGIVNDNALGLYRGYQAVRGIFGASDAASNIRAANETETQVTPQIQNPFGRIAYGVASGIGGAAIPVASGFVGGPAATVGMFAAQGGLEALAQAKAEGVNVTKQVAVATATAALNAAGGRIAMGTLFTSLGKAGFSDFVAHYLAKTAPAMVVNQVAASAVSAAANPDKTWIDWLKEQPEGIATALGTGLALDVGGRAVGKATQAIRGRTELPAPRVTPPLTSEGTPQHYVDNQGVLHVVIHPPVIPEALKTIVAEKTGQEPAAVSDDAALHHIGESFRDKAPAAQDFKDTAVVIAGAENEEKTAETLRIVYKATGIPPEEIYEDSKNDPEVKDDIISGKIPEKYAPMIEAENTKEEPAAEEGKPVTERPGRETLSPDHQSLEDNLGVPEQMTASQLGKLDRKIGAIFASTGEGGLPKTEDLTDAQYEALEDYARRVEAAREAAKGTAFGKLSGRASDGRTLSELPERGEQGVAAIAATGSEDSGKSESGPSEKENEVSGGVPPQPPGGGEPPEPPEEPLPKLPETPEEAHASADKALSFIRRLSIKIANSDIVHNLKMFVNPDSASSPEARARAKDVADHMNWTAWYGDYLFKILGKEFTPAENQKMFLDREATSLYMLRLEKAGASREESLKQAQDNKIGIFGENVSAKERQWHETLDKWTQEVQKELIEQGRLPRDKNIPYWTPRVGAMEDEKGIWRKLNLSERAPALNAIGQRFTKSSPHLMKRSYETIEETEAAMQKLAEDHDISSAELVKDIRTMPLALARLSNAAAAGRFIDQIAETFKNTGSAFSGPEQWEGHFTLDHPAFTKWIPRKDEQGNVVFEKHTQNIPNEYKGSITALLRPKDPALYRALMDLKRVSMHNIMFSPFIHMQVLWGKALAAMPWRVMTGQVTADGERAVADPEVMQRFIKAGMVPMGSTGYGNDVDTIQEGEQLRAGQSLTSRAIGGAVGAVNEEAGEATKRALDAMDKKFSGDMLWGWAGKLQAGVALNLSEDIQRKNPDIPQAVADQIGAHFGNLFGGAIPKESMGVWAERISNLLLFSRSFTFTNIGIIKNMFGLPGNTHARIERDYGSEVAKQANSIARTEATHTFMRDVALAYIGTGLMQTVYNIAKDTIDNKEKYPENNLMQNLGEAAQQEYEGYIRRAHTEAEDIAQNPYAAVLKMPVHIYNLLPNSENEPGKEDRIFIGQDSETGTNYYMRIPTGKVGEDLVHWFTQPFTTLRSKLSPQAAPLLDSFTNSDAYHHNIYDPDAAGAGGAIHNVGLVAMHFLEAQTPADTLEAAGRVLEGKGTALDYGKMAGPAVGLTFSKGYPGGPAAGLEAEVRRHAAVKRAMALPDIKAAVMDGKDDKAHEIMDGLGMTPREQNHLIDNYKHPEKTLTARKIRAFERTATPEEKEEMERLQEREYQ